VAFLRRHRIHTIAAVLVIAEHRAPRTVTVVSAMQRTLPLPLSRPPREHVLDWLGRGAPPA